MPQHHGLVVPVAVSGNGATAPRCGRRRAELERRIPHDKRTPSIDSYPWLFAATGAFHRALARVRLAVPRPVIATHTPSTLRRWLTATSTTVGTLRMERRSSTLATRAGFFADPIAIIHSSRPLLDLSSRLLTDIQARLPRAWPQRRKDGQEFVLLRLATHSGIGWARLARKPLGQGVRECHAAIMQQPAVVRPGDLSHVDAIIAYDHIARAGEAGRVRGLREAAQAGWLRVAIRDQRIVGHAIVRRRVFFGSDFLDLVYVAEFARRSGIGRLLVNSVRDQLSGRVWTSTNLSNAAMHRLLQTSGWHPAGMLSGLDDGDPEVFYFSDQDGDAD